MGNIYDDKRSSLLVDRAENIVFLHHNINILDRLDQQRSSSNSK